MTGTSFIQLDFIFIIYIVYKKFITFLLYFDQDCKYPNFRIVVDARKYILYNSCTITIIFYAYEAKLKRYFSLQRKYKSLLFLLLPALMSYTRSKSSQISLHLRNDAVVVSSWGLYGCLWMSMIVSGCLWVSMSVYGYWWDLWLFTGINDVYEYLWVYGCLWVSMSLWGLWVFMGFYGYYLMFIFKHKKYCLFSHSGTSEDLRTPENVWNHTNVKCTTGERDFIDSCVFSTRPRLPLRTRLRHVRADLRLVLRTPTCQ